MIGHSVLGCAEHDGDDAGGVGIGEFGDEVALALGGEGVDELVGERLEAGHQALDEPPARTPG